ncbi:unnamed protein product [Bemisia tabaci]|uniref:C2H2-type domain-containing protein n=1 Tax=Bemisia tabaci TaxID=7038 RepID=A0A9P0G1J5_BEMTA|nr:unnamed protein product [Bemisia tabaci]
MTDKEYDPESFRVEPTFSPDINRDGGHHEELDLGFATLSVIKTEPPSDIGQNSEPVDDSENFFGSWEVIKQEPYSPEETVPLAENFLLSPDFINKEQTHFAKRSDLPIDGEADTPIWPNSCLSGKSSEDDEYRVYNEIVRSFPTTFCKKSTQFKSNPAISCNFSLPGTSNNYFFFESSVSSVGNRFTGDSDELSADFLTNFNEQVILSSVENKSVRSVASLQGAKSYQHRWKNGRKRRKLRGHVWSKNKKQAKKNKSLLHRHKTLETSSLSHQAHSSAQKYLQTDSYEPHEEIPREFLSSLQLQSRSDSSRSSVKQPMLPSRELDQMPEVILNNEINTPEDLSFQSFDSESLLSSLRTHNHSLLKEGNERNKCLRCGLNFHLKPRLLSKDFQNSGSHYFQCFFCCASYSKACKSGFKSHLGAHILSFFFKCCNRELGFKINFDYDVQAIIKKYGTKSKNSASIAKNPPTGLDQRNRLNRENACHRNYDLAQTVLSDGELSVESDLDSCEDQTGPQDNSGIISQRVPEISDTFTVKTWESDAELLKGSSATNHHQKSSTDPLGASEYLKVPETSKSNLASIEEKFTLVSDLKPRLFTKIDLNSGVCSQRPVSNRSILTCLSEEDMKEHCQRVKNGCARLPRIVLTPVTEDSIKMYNSSLRMKRRIRNKEVMDAETWNKRMSEKLKRVCLESQSSLQECKKCHNNFVKHAKVDLLLEMGELSPCGKCFTSFHFKHRFEKHVMASHPFAGPFACYLCKLKCQTWDQFVYHMKLHDLNRHLCQDCSISVHQNVAYSHELLIQRALESNIDFKSNFREWSVKRSIRPDNLNENLPSLDVLNKIIGIESQDSSSDLPAACIESRALSIMAPDLEGKVTDSNIALVQKVSPSVGRNRKFKKRRRKFRKLPVDLSSLSTIGVFFNHDTQTIVGECLKPTTDPVPVSSVLETASTVFDPLNGSLDDSLSTQIEGSITTLAKHFSKNQKDFDIFEIYSSLDTNSYSPKRQSKSVGKNKGKASCVTIVRTSPKASSDCLNEIERPSSPIFYYEDENDETICSLQNSLKQCKEILDKDVFEQSEILPSCNFKSSFLQDDLLKNEESAKQLTSKQHNSNLHSQDQPLAVGVSEELGVLPSDEHCLSNHQEFCGPSNTGSTTLSAESATIHKSAFNSGSSKELLNYKGSSNPLSSCHIEVIGIHFIQETENSTGDFVDQSSADRENECRKDQNEIKVSKLTFGSVDSMKLARPSSIVSPHPNEVFKIPSSECCTQISNSAVKFDMPSKSKESVLLSVASSVVMNAPTPVEMDRTALSDTQSLLADLCERVEMESDPIGNVKVQSSNEETETLSVTSGAAVRESAVESVVDTDRTALYDTQSLLVEMCDRVEMDLDSTSNFEVLSSKGEIETLSVISSAVMNMPTIESAVEMDRITLFDAQSLLAEMCERVEMNSDLSSDIEIQSKIQETKAQSVVTGSAVNTLIVESPDEIDKTTQCDTQSLLVEMCDRVEMDLDSTSNFEILSSKGEIETLSVISSAVMNMPTIESAVEMDRITLCDAQNLLAEMCERVEMNFDLSSDIEIPSKIQETKAQSVVTGTAVNTLIVESPDEIDKTAQCDTQSRLAEMCEKIGMDCELESQFTYKNHSHIGVLPRNSNIQPNLDVLNMAETHTCANSSTATVMQYHPKESPMDQNSIPLDLSKPYDAGLGSESRSVSRSSLGLSSKNPPRNEPVINRISPLLDRRMRFPLNLTKSAPSQANILSESMSDNMGDSSSDDEETVIASNVSGASVEVFEAVESLLSEVEQDIPSFSSTFNESKNMEAWKDRSGEDSPTIGFQSFDYSDGCSYIADSSSDDEETVIANNVSGASAEVFEAVESLLSEVEQDIPSFSSTFNESKNMKAWKDRSREASPTIGFQSFDCSDGCSYIADSSSDDEETVTASNASSASAEVFEAVESLLSEVEQDAPSFSSTHNGRENIKTWKNKSGEASPTIGFESFDHSYSKIDSILINMEGKTKKQWSQSRNLPTKRALKRLHGSEPVSSTGSDTDSSYSLRLSAHPSRVFSSLRKSVKKRRFLGKQKDNKQSCNSLNLGNEEIPVEDAKKNQRGRKRKKGWNPERAQRQAVICRQQGRGPNGRFLTKTQKSDKKSKQRPSHVLDHSYSTLESFSSLRSQNSSNGDTTSLSDYNLDKSECESAADHSRSKTGGSDTYRRGFKVRRKKVSCSLKPTSQSLLKPNQFHGPSDEFFASGVKNHATEAEVKISEGLKKRRKRKIYTADVQRALRSRYTSQSSSDYPKCQSENSAEKPTVLKNQTFLKNSSTDQESQKHIGVAIMQVPGSNKEPAEISAVPISINSSESSQVSSQLSHQAKRKKRRRLARRFCHRTLSSKYRYSKLQNITPQSAERSVIGDLSTNKGESIEENLTIGKKRAKSHNKNDMVKNYSSRKVLMDDLGSNRFINKGEDNIGRGNSPKVESTKHLDNTCTAKTFQKRQKQSSEKRLCKGRKREAIASIKNSPLPDNNVLSMFTESKTIENSSSPAKKRKKRNSRKPFTVRKRRTNVGNNLITSNSASKVKNENTLEPSENGRPLNATKLQSARIKFTGKQHLQKVGRSHQRSMKSNAKTDINQDLNNVLAESVEILTEVLQSSTSIDHQMETNFSFDVPSQDNAQGDTAETNPNEESRFLTTDCHSDLVSSVDNNNLSSKSSNDAAGGTTESKLTETVAQRSSHRRNRGNRLTEICLMIRVPGLPRKPKPGFVVSKAKTVNLQSSKITKTERRNVKSSRDLKSKASCAKGRKAKKQFQIRQRNMRSKQLNSVKITTRTAQEACHPNSKNDEKNLATPKPLPATTEQQESKEQMRKYPTKPRKGCSRTFSARHVLFKRRCLTELLETVNYINVNQLDSSQINSGFKINSDNRPKPPKLMKRRKHKKSSSSKSAERKGKERKNPSLRTSSKLYKVKKLPSDHSLTDLDTCGSSLNCAPAEDTKDSLSPCEAERNQALKLFFSVNLPTLKPAFSEENKHCSESGAIFSSPCSSSNTLKKLEFAESQAAEKISELSESLGADNNSIKSTNISVVTSKPSNEDNDRNNEPSTEIPHVVSTGSPSPVLSDLESEHNNLSHYTSSDSGSRNQGFESSSPSITHTSIQKEFCVEDKDKISEHSAKKINLDSTEEPNKSMDCTVSSGPKMAKISPSFRQKPNECQFQVAPAVEHERRMNLPQSQAMNINPWDSASGPDSRMYYPRQSEIMPSYQHFDPCFESNSRGVWTPPYTNRDHCQEMFHNYHRNNPCSTMNYYASAGAQSALQSAASRPNFCNFPQYTDSHSTSVPISLHNQNVSSHEHTQQFYPNFYSSMSNTTANPINYQTSNFYSPQISATFSPNSQVLSRLDSNYSQVGPSVNQSASDLGNYTSSQNYICSEPIPHSSTNSNQESTPSNMNGPVYMTL